ncbi:MAG: Flp pilus assembly complex ATPase component TadA [Candidatus Hydrogenedentes bacterium]|nr:Flp pilus assembly complex ATPase component TadA [Candidatus Hydrogenedentota bacterium]
MTSPRAEKALHSAIGDALVNAGAITPEQLTRALRVQSLLEDPKQLVEVLVELGYGTRQSLNDAIAQQGSHLRLGDLLVEQGLITADTLTMALQTQKEQGVRLGEALISLGAINERTLLRNIAHQSNVPYIDPNFNMIEPDLLRGISPEFLLKSQFIPFIRGEDGIVTVIVSDLGNTETRQAIQELYRKDVKFALGPREAIRQCIHDIQNLRTRGEHAGQTAGRNQEDTIVPILEHLINEAIEEGASDIHIEPMESLVRIRYRIDGVLVYKTDLPKELLIKLISRLKILSELNIAEHHRHQGGRFQYEFKGREVDLRLSLYVTVFGESAVMRILNREMALVTLDQLGMAPNMLARYREDVLHSPTGVVLYTGPTGSGKTTTLYSSIAYCNNISTKIITAEDPVEFTIEGIIQCSISDKMGRSFASTLREIVRQDPDIIVMGEIRDKESAEVAIQAALTGHKVYSTFHTEDTIGGLLRLIDMDIETFLISSTVVSVVAQRLLRRICEECKAPYVPAAKEAQSVGLGLDELRQYEYKRGRGCNHCAYTGYRGRIGAYELLVLNDPVKEAILAKKPAHTIRELSVETTGLISMREDACAKVVRGYTTFDEVLRHTPRTFSVRPLRQILSLSE